MAREEVSEGGSRIYRHEARDPDEELRFSGGDADLIEGVEAHLDACFGDVERSVFHEIISPTVHIDVHLVPPNDEFPFNRIVTTGMAEKPMSVPDGFDEETHAELTLALPAEWPLTQDAFEDERWYWPVRLLKQLARLPHEYDTFLWHGHTIPNGNPPEPYAASTELCCALIAPPLAAPDEFERLELADGRAVRFLAVMPLYEDEMNLKLKRGADSLYALFDEHEVTDLLDPSRPSVAPAKRRGLFRR